MLARGPTPGFIVVRGWELFISLKTEPAPGDLIRKEGGGGIESR